MQYRSTGDVICAIKSAWNRMKMHQNVMFHVANVCIIPLEKSVRLSMILLFCICIVIMVNITTEKLTQMYSGDRLVSLFISVGGIILPFFDVATSTVYSCI